MVLVASAQPLKGLGVVPDNHGVHALGDRDLPGVILAQALGCPALAQRRTLGVLTPDGLPAERAKRLADRNGVRCPFEHFSGCHRRNPKFGSRIAHGPCSRRSALVRGDLIEKVDDERGIEEETTHLRGVMRSRSSPA